MDKVLVLTPGEKIKHIRKSFKFTQGDVAGNSITRNLISLIESNKATLTPQVATVIAANINRLCKDEGIDFTTSEDYLLESVEKQIKKQAQEYIDYLSDPNLMLSDKFRNKLIIIESFLARHDLSDIKLEIYYLIAEIYIKHNEFSYAYKYYTKAYENSGKLSSDNSKQTNLLFSLAFCCNNLNKYRECLDYYKILDTYSNTLPKNLIYKLKINVVLTYKKLNKYDDCLDLINLIQNKYEFNDQENFAILNTKANCYMHKKAYSLALDLQKQILLIINDDNLESKLIILCNMMEIYTILHDTVNLKKLICKCSQYISAYSQLEIKHYSQDIYNYIGISFSELKDYENAKKFFLKSIEECRLYKNTKAVSESFENLIDVYVLLDDKNGLNDLKNKLLEFISLDLIPRNSILVLKLIRYYNNVTDRENIQNILNFVLEFTNGEASVG